MSRRIQSEWCIATVASIRHVNIASVGCV